MGAVGDVYRSNYPEEVLLEKWTRREADLWLETDCKAGSLAWKW